MARKRTAPLILALRDPAFQEDRPRLNSRKTYSTIPDKIINLRLRMCWAPRVLLRIENRVSIEGSHKDVRTLGL